MKQQSMLDVVVLQMLDHYGLTSLFLTTTPDDECSFSVRLYAKPEDWVSTILIFLLTIYFTSQ